MSTLRPLAVLVLLAVAAGCASTAPPPPAPPPDPVDPAPAPTSTRDLLVGEWRLTGMFDDGADVSAQQNPDGDRYIDLRADGSFVSGGGPSGRNAGRWTYDPASRELGLDSDLGPDNDSIWLVVLRDDGAEMEWLGRGSEFARRIRITSRRAD